MPSVYRPLVNFVAKAMQAVLNLALLCLGIILVVFLGKETLHLAHVEDVTQMLYYARLKSSTKDYRFEDVNLNDCLGEESGFHFHCAISSISRYYRNCAAYYRRCESPLAVLIYSRRS